MSILQAVTLGIVQGLTEFLPVSSSGHLVLFQNIMGINMETNIFFDVMVHIGTLISVLVVFYNDIALMVREFFLLAGDFVRGRKITREGNPHRNMLIMIIIATIPTAVIGIALNGVFEMLFSSVRVVSVTLIITGILLFVADRLEGTYKGARDIKTIDAVVVGLFQGIAITPGISRSGSTIFAGLLRGFNRELATKFSFILSIPAISGAALLEGKDFLLMPSSGYGFGITLIGLAAAAVSGTFAIKFLVKLLMRGKLHYFSYYCWAVGTTAFVYSFIML